MCLGGDEGLWQRSPWGLAGSSPVRGTGEEGGKTAACGRRCLLNRIRSLKIGWRTTNFTDNVGVSVKKQKKQHKIALLILLIVLCQQLCTYVENV